MLEAIGRRHTAADIVAALDRVRAVGGFTVNMDLIAGLPGDSVAGFRDTLEKVLTLGAENVTVHTLALKRGADLAGGETPSLELFRREEGIPSEQSVAEMIDRGSRLIIDRGYHPYYLYRQKYMAGGFENVGWALDGMDSVYNICIMEELCSILSLGCGGVTKLTDRRSPRRISNPKYPKEYIARSEEEWDAADEKLRTWVRGQQEREGSHVF